MTIPAVGPSKIRSMLLLREEIALLDLRHEAAYATGHPLFAANMAASRITLEAEVRLPRKDVPIVVYDAGEGLVARVLLLRLRIVSPRWAIPTSVNSKEAWKPGGKRDLRFSSTSIPMPRRSVNWSSLAVTPRHCRRKKLPR